MSMMGGGRRQSQELDIPELHDFGALVWLASHPDDAKKFYSRLEKLLKDMVAERKLVGKAREVESAHDQITAKLAEAETAVMDAKTEAAGIIQSAKRDAASMAVEKSEALKEIEVAQANLDRRRREKTAELDAREERIVVMEKRIAKSSAEIETLVQSNRAKEADLDSRLDKIRSAMA